MSRTITTNYANGLTLTNASDNPISIASGVSVTDTTGSALQSTSSIYWSLTNSGSVQANGTAAGSGIAFAAGAALTNTSGGVVSGYAFGVSVAGSGSVVNTGRISSGKTTGSGFTYNQTIHSFSALSAGLFLAGGEITNNTGGTISGYFEGAVIGGGGSLVNAGSITGTGSAQGLGIVLPSGGSVTNLSGGLISGDAYAMVSLGGGYVDNQGGATLTSPTLGIFALYKAETVTNQGAINGTKVAGVDLLGGGAVQNAAGASIAGGYYGVQISGSPGVVTNQGLIKGLAAVPAGSSYYDKPFPFSGVLMPAGGSVRNSTGATISGGSYGVRVAAAYGAVINSGVISSSRTFGGAGVDLAGGGTAVNGAGGIIAAKWIGVQIGQAGTNTGGTFVNYGTVFASDGTNGAAVWIHGPGEIVNNAGGTIAGGSYAGIANGPFGIVSYYQTTVINRGSIGGTAFAFDSAGTSAVGNRIEIAPGSSFGGTVEGAASSALASLATLELLSGASTGTVSGFGSQYQNFGNIALDTGAQWTLGGTVAAGTTIAFAAGGTGSLTIANPASMSGTISGFGAGETLSLSGITNATGVSLGANNVLTVTESTGQTLTLQLDPTQSFAGATFNETVSGGATDITVTDLIASYYQAVLRVQPATSVVQADATALSNGSLTASGLLAQLLSSAQATTVPALLCYDFMVGVTPSSPGVDFLTNFATDLQTGNYTYNGGFVQGTTPGEFNSLAFSVLNTFVNFCATDVQISGNPFTAEYGQLAQTASVANRTTFFQEVYQQIFGAAPAVGTTNLFVNNLVADPEHPGQQITTFQFYVEYAGSELGAYGAVAGVLLSAAETSSPQLGPYPGPVTSFLTEAATSSATGPDTAPYGSSLLTAFPAAETAASAITLMTQPGSENDTGNATVTGTDIAASDPAIITISGVNQLTDPGAGNHTIQFLASASADALVLHASGVDQVSGFDPATDFLDVSSLLSEAHVNLNDIAALGSYLTVVDQGANALLRFDPTGHGGGSTVAVLHGLGSTVPSLNALVTSHAIRIT